MPRSHHRPRRTVSVTTARLLSLIGFRYSATRDAYVLRFIGNQIGPVFQVDTHPELRSRSQAADRETAGVR